MLPKEIHSLVTLCQAHPEQEGLFDALLALLDNASDSSIISEALSALPREKLTAQAASCQRAGDLLKRANDHDSAAQWLAGASNIHDAEGLQTATNVIPFGSGERGEGCGLADIKSEAAVSMDDIAGLQDVKKQIYRKIVKPFENPALYARFKRRAGGGLLMYGPPGCGKTLIAKAIAHECKADFFEIHAGEILDKFVGVAEKRILDIFQKGRAAQPSVLFFDEIEALAHRRNYSGGDAQNTLISTILREMDGVSKENKGLLFLGATNVPWSIDPAFKRPGRFDRTLFVPPPDRIARNYLLKSLFKERPVDKSVTLQRLVDKTSGFSGADIEALVETAVDYAIDDSDGGDEITPISNQHLSDALREISSSIGEWFGLAKSFVEYGNQDGQYDELKKFLKRYG